MKSKGTKTVLNVPDAFFTNVFKHYSLPDSIISSRDNKFRSEC